MSPEPSGLCNDVPGMPRPARMQLNDVFLVERQHVTPLKSEGSKGGERGDAASEAGGVECDVHDVRGDAGVR